MRSNVCDHLAKKVSFIYTLYITTEGHIATPAPLFILTSDALSHLLAQVCRWACLSSQEEIRKNLS